MKSSQTTLEHTLPRPKGLIECDTVLDIGAGIRPMNWYVPKSHVCTDPYEPYYLRLCDAGYEAVQGTALDVLAVLSSDAIYLLDVLEHMHKNEGIEVIDLAKKKAIKQIVIFTPKGFVQQTKDAWNMGGEYWQTHRSGWLPGEFPGWDISFYDEGFFAIWTNTHN